MTSSILYRLKTENSPIIDQKTATFVWRGRNAPDLVGDFTGWEDGDPVRLEKSGPGVWTYRITLPADAYIQYSFMEDEEYLKDPFNPRRTYNGVGGYNNYFSMPGYKPTDLARNIPHIPHGIVTQHSIPTEYFISGRYRKVHFYRPPTKEPVPLIVVWDGREYLRRARLNYIVDNLIYQKRIRPVAMAFVENGGQISRASEYACNEATLVFLMTQVMPLAAKELYLLDINTFPGKFGVLGSSMGGLMALYTGTRLSHVFGKVLSQSGAFTWAGMDMVVFDLVENCMERELKIWMDVGTYDLLGLLESNRRMKNILDHKRYTPVYREFNAGHNYHAWRNDIWRGLEALYGAG